MLNELIESVLLLVVALLLKIVFAAIGIEIDEVVFNTIVGAIVVWLMAKLGLGLAVKGLAKVFPGAVKRGLLKAE